MQIQRKSNGSAALRIAGRLIFSSAFLLAVGGIAALVVSLLFCHASSLDLVNSFPRLLPVPPFPAHEKTALCLDRAVNSVGWQSIFGCFM